MTPMMIAFVSESFDLLTSEMEEPLVVDTGDGSSELVLVLTVWNELSVDVSVVDMKIKWFSRYSTEH